MSCAEIQRIQFTNDEKLTFELTVRHLRCLFADNERYALTTPHRLDFFSLIFITRGEGFHAIDFNQYPYKPGSLFLVSRHQIHQFFLNDQVDGYVLTFTENVLFNSQNDICKSPFLQLFENTNHLDSTSAFANSAIGVADRFHQLAEEYRQISPFREEILRALLRSLILRLTRSVVQPEEAISTDGLLFNQFRELLERNFTSCRQVAEYATRLGRSARTLNSATRSVTGKTAKEIIDDRVIIEMKRLLAYSGLTINEMADQLGFDEATNLAKFFKRHTRLSPKEFRNINRLQQNSNGQIYW